MVFLLLNSLNNGNFLINWSNKFFLLGWYSIIHSSMTMNPPQPGALSYVFAFTGTMEPYFVSLIIVLRINMF
jgi:hypothetical protein